MTKGNQHDAIETKEPPSPRAWPEIKRKARHLRSLRLTDEEDAAYVARATAMGVPVSTWMRVTCNTAAGVVHSPALPFTAERSLAGGRVKRPQPTRHRVRQARAR